MDEAEFGRKLRQQLDRVGRQNGTAYPEAQITPPASLSNDETNRVMLHDRLMFDLHVARSGAKYFEGRRKTLEQQAEAAGLLDYSKIGPGGSGTIYDGPFVAVSGRVNGASSRLDKTKLAQLMRDAGMRPDKVHDIIEEAHVSVAGARVPTFVLKWSSLP